MVTTERQYKVVGTRPIRHDGVDKVTGRAQYGADIRLPGMLYGRMLRSPHAHARIKRIDTSKAAVLPGVKAVITAADFPPDEDEERVTNFGPFVVKFRWYRDNLMASDKVLYQGHAVAAVCATDQHIAEDALRLIEVEYELLPLVLDVRDAMLDDAPILQEGVNAPESMGQGADKPSNVNLHIHHEVGDVEAGFGEADVIIEREFETTMVHQGYIELQNGSAFWNKDDEVTIWTSTQGNFGMRDTTAKILQLPVSKVKVSPVEIGGGFGGKIHSYLEPIAALLSKKSGRPVKMYMSRTDVLQGTGPTCGTYDRIKIGAKKDGTIVAAEAYLAYEAGAYMGAPIMPGCMAVFAPYEIPHQRVDGYEVFVNKPRVSAYRAPGAPAAEYASECVIDELAEKLDIDPIELRLQNASVEGTQRADGYKFGIIGNVACLEAAKNSPHYKSELTGENRGRGVASGFWFNIGQESGAIAAVNADGTVSLSLGSPDIGGTRVAIAMQLAETLGITAQDVKPQVVDTDSVGYTFVTGGSRTAFAGGWAAHEAALDLRRLLEERAAAIWECERADVAYGDDGVIRGPKDEDGNERSFTFKEIAAPVARYRRPAHGQGGHQQDQLRTGVRHAHCGRGSGPGDRQSRNPALYGRSGSRHRHPPFLRGGTGAGRRCPGHRHGAQRGVLLRRRGPSAQLQPSGLPHADGAGPAHDRDDPRRGAQSGASIRRSRRWRGAHHPAAAGAPRRHQQRHWCAHE